MSGAVDWLAPEEVVDGRYRIRAPLGRGGGGQVYEADDLRLQRRIALKVAPRGRDGELLTGEAVALASIRDPAVVDIHATGEHGRLVYVAMERLYGVTLAQHLARTAADTPLPGSEILALLIAVCEGLGALHRGGLFHGDLKPANVILAPGGRTVLLDVAIGSRRTPHYLAPELLVAGAPVGSPAADLYALGVVGHELCTGRVPFDGNSVPAVLYKHLHAAPPDLAAARPDLSLEVVAVLRSLMAKNPGARPSSAEAVTWRLLDALHQAPRRARAEAPRVMIVDDDPDVEPLAAAAVREIWPDAQVDVANDGAEALLRIRAAPPDIVLLDLVMPVMSGIELCTHLRSAGLAPRCQFVSIGSRTDADDVSILNQLGITRFVPKGRGFAERLTRVLAELAAAPER